MREFDVVTGERGLRLRVCSWGDKHPRPTLILHGYLEQAAAWDAVATALPGQILAPDHRGHGLSEHVGNGGFYHFWDYVSDVDGLIQEIAPEGPIDVIGHSMGGTLACLFAALRPELIRRLVLIEGLGPPDFGLTPHARALQFLTHQRKKPRHRPMASLEDGVARMRANNPGIPEAVARALVVRMTRPVEPEDPMVEPGSTGSLVWTWDPIHKSRSPQQFHEEMFISFLRQIQAPTWLVDGADSPYAALPHDHRAQAIPNVQGRVRVPGAGHLLHHDQPQALAEVLRSLLFSEHP